MHACHCEIDRFLLADGTPVRLRLAYAWGGAAQGPAYLVLHGYSGSHLATADLPPQAADAGWAAAWAGPGKAIDPARHRILTVNLPGSCYGSAWQGAVQSYASVENMVQAIEALFDELGLEHLAGAIGYSFGGYVALALKASAPQRVGRVLGICTAPAGRGSWSELQMLQALDTPGKRYEFRMQTLLRAGLAEWAQDQGDEALERERERVRRWSAEFDAAALWRLRAAAVRFALPQPPPDTTMLYASSDALFPPPPEGNENMWTIPTRYGHQSLLLDPGAWIDPIAQWVRRCDERHTNSLETNP